MNDNQIEDMIEELVKAVDYDQWQELFDNPTEPEVARDVIAELVAIVHEHLID